MLARASSCWTATRWSKDLRRAAREALAQPPDSARVGAALQALHDREAFEDGNDVADSDP